jgi:hypothetical protein
MALVNSDDETAKGSQVLGPEKSKALSIFGPGLITGASDDDPSGIATYSQVGAQFGFSICRAAKRCLAGSRRRLTASMVLQPSCYKGQIEPI